MKSKIREHLNINCEFQIHNYEQVTSFGYTKIFVVSGQVCQNKKGYLFYTPSSMKPEGFVNTLKK